jgi:hypothetical protein
MAGIAGALVSARLQSNREMRAWLRDKRGETYVMVTEFAIRERLRLSSIPATFRGGESIPPIPPRPNDSEWFRMNAEVSTFASDEVENCLALVRDARLTFGTAVEDMAFLADLGPGMGPPDPAETAMRKETRQELDQARTEVMELLDRLRGRIRIEMGGRGRRRRPTVP